MKNILIIGTVDTKSDEIEFMRECIKNLECNPVLMDVSVLGDPPIKVDYSKHDVAEHANMTNKEIISLGNENDAMIASAKGAKSLTLKLCKEKKIDGAIALGGTMGTDLALDVFSELPLGFPKCLLSTVAGSPLIEPQRLPSDIITVLWAGGLYGLNTICKSSLSQACGAVVGATLAKYEMSEPKPIVAITSLGTSALKYIITLLPELEKRGFEGAVFHTTGMGGSAMESLIKLGRIVAVMDFSLVEISNYYFGSEVNAGKDRLEVAGKFKIPQIVAPGGLTVVDAKTWSQPPKDFEGREFRPHNRLITCAALSASERKKAASIIGEKLMKSKGPTAFIMTHGGFDDWDREGEWAFDQNAINSFHEEMKNILKEPVKYYEIKQNINEPEFTSLALQIFDEWLDEGLIKIN